MSKNIVRDGGRGEPGEAVTRPPPIGYDPHVLIKPVTTTQEANAYIRAATAKTGTLEYQKQQAQDAADALVKAEWSNISTVVRTEEGGPGVYLYKDPIKGKYTADSFRKFQEDTQKFVEGTDKAIAQLQENISTINSALETAAVSTQTARQYFTVKDPRTGATTQFTDKQTAIRYRDNLVAELTKAKDIRISSADRQARERMQEIASQTRERVPVKITAQQIALNKMANRQLVTSEIVNGNIVYRLWGSPYELSEPDKKLAKDAGFKLEPVKAPSPWTEASERKLEVLFRNSIGLSGGTKIGNYERLGTELAKASNTVTFNPVADNPSLEWVGNQLIEGGVKSVPLWVGGRLVMAVVGAAGMTIVPLYQYLAGLAAGGYMVPQVDFVVPKDVYALNQKTKAFVKEHPEVILEATLEGVGGLITMGALEVGLSKVQQARLNKIYKNIDVEDFFVDEEILMQYPTDASYQQIVHETIYVPKNTHLITQDIPNPAEMLKTGYKKGAIYKLGNEYGIVMIGEGSVVVKITPGMQTTPMTVWKPMDITNVVDVIKHNPGIIIDLNRLTSQGINLPAWLAGAGVKVSIMSESDMKNMSIEGTQVIIDQDENVFYKTVEGTDTWSDQTIQQRMDLDVETVLEDVLGETSKFESIELPSVDFIQEFEQPIELDIGEVGDIETETGVIPVVIPDIVIDVTPIPPVEIEISQLDQPLPIDPIERQVEEYRRKLKREGRSGISQSVQTLRKSLKAKEIKKRKQRKQKPSSKNQSYRVYFVYPTGASEAQSVAAKKFREAYYIGNRIRKIKLHPKEIEIEFRGELKI